MSLRIKLRSALRCSVFFSLIGVSLLECAFLFVTTRRSDLRKARANWLHRWCKVYERVLGIRSTRDGGVPLAGLLVSNHVSYLDIITIGATAPSVFVSKKEVRTWPVFGICAQAAGTLFVDRERRGEVESVATQMEEVLAQGLLLVLFPEGTSSDGASVLPFKTSLFEPVAHLNFPAMGAAISYTLEGGSVADEICYWGEMTLAPHLLNVFSKPFVKATLRFGPARVRVGGRKAVARELYDEVALLHAGESMQEPLPINLGPRRVTLATAGAA